LKFLSRILGDEVYEVRQQPTVLPALKIFRIQPYLSSRKLSCVIHASNSVQHYSHQSKKAPVIIVTGIYKDAVYKTEALRSLGASAFFEKPLNLEALLAKVYELIGKPEVKKHQVKKEDEDLDELLKQALSSAYTPGQPAETNRPVDRTPRREESRKNSSRFSG
jgi:DNA-binding NtrC family response regulator